MNEDPYLNASLVRLTSNISPLSCREKVHATKTIRNADRGIAILPDRIPIRDLFHDGGCLPSLAFSGVAVNDI